MLLFNNAINSLGLVELPLFGRKYTWTNKQSSPLLERLDWFFTSSSWTTSYLITTVSSLVMQTSDHWPCKITISTSIPKGKVFRFENYWLQHPSFIQTAQEGWQDPSNQLGRAKAITAKCKNLRKILRSWQQKLSNLKKNLENVKTMLSLLEIIEEHRDLTVMEWNFRETLIDKLNQLLDQQKVYWKQRSKIKWIKEGDAGTKLFHTHATIKHKNNLIAQLQKSNGEIVLDHAEKEKVLWEAFKERLGQSEFSTMAFNLSLFVERHVNLDWLEESFTRDEIDAIIK